MCHGIEKTLSSIVNANVSTVNAITQCVWRDFKHAFIPHVTDTLLLLQKFTQAKVGLFPEVNMTQTKSDINKKHYEKNSDVLKEKARERRAQAKKIKTFGELMKELADNTQLAETKFLEQVVQKTGLNELTVATAYKKMRSDLKLTEHQRTHIHNNIAAKKALLERLTREHELGDLL